MKNEMNAELLFLDPDDLDTAMPKLIEHGLTITRLDDWVDPCGPTVWIIASLSTELDQDGFFDWIKNIVDPLDGDVVVAGLGWDPSWGERRADPQTLEN
jgi:hypothetical protein